MQPRTTRGAARRPGHRGLSRQRLGLRNAVAATAVTTAARHHGAALLAPSRRRHSSLRRRRHERRLESCRRIDVAVPYGAVPGCAVVNADPVPCALDDGLLTDRNEIGLAFGETPARDSDSLAEPIAVERRLEPDHRVSGDLYRARTRLGPSGSSQDHWTRKLQAGRHLAFAHAPASFMQKAVVPLRRWASTGLMGG